MYKKDLFKLFLRTVLLFYIFIPLYSDDSIIEDLQNTLKNPDIKFNVSSLLDIPKENKDQFCNYEFIKKRNGKKWLKKVAETNKMISDYYSVGSFLGKFSNEISFGVKTKISNDIGVALVKSIIQSDPKRVVLFSHKKKDYVEPWQYDVAPRMTNNIAEGFLLVLYRGKTPVYAFDIKSSTKVLLPFHYNATPARFYKLYFDDKKRLYMFDSFIFFPNDKTKKLMNKLWDKLNIVAFLSEKTDRKLLNGNVNAIFAGFFKYVPEEALNKRAFYKVNNLTFKFYTTWIKHIELKKKSNMKKLVELKNNISSKSEKATIEKIEERINYYNLSIKQINEEFDFIKRKIGVRN